MGLQADIDRRTGRQSDIKTDRQSEWTISHANSQENRGKAGRPVVNV